MQNDMKRDYDNQLNELNKLNQKVMANHNKVSQYHDDTIKTVIDEKHEVEMERQKLSLETKKIQRYQAQLDEKQSQASQSNQGSNVDLIGAKPTF